MQGKIFQLVWKFMWGVWKAFTQHAWRTTNRACTLKACLSSVPQNKSNACIVVFYVTVFRDVLHVGRHSDWYMSKNIHRCVKQYPHLAGDGCWFHTLENIKRPPSICEGLLCSNLIVWLCFSRVSRRSVVEAARSAPVIAQEESWKQSGETIECLSLHRNSCRGQITFVFPLV